MSTTLLNTNTSHLQKDSNSESHLINESSDLNKEISIDESLSLATDPNSVKEPDDGSKKIDSADATNVVPSDHVSSNLETTNKLSKSDDEIPETALSEGRRIIAEDSQWNLAMVERLTKLCINVIVENFQEKPILKGLPNHHRRDVLNRISLDIPVQLLVDIIPDELYWHRRALAQHENCDIALHGGSWKRLFCERTLENEIANFRPCNGEEFGFSLLAIQLSSSIKRLKIDQLRPAESDTKTRTLVDPTPDHMDPILLIENLPNLKEVSFYYGMRQLGMQFSQHYFGMSENDSINLGKALKKCEWNKLLLTSCMVDNGKLAHLCEGLAGHRFLRYLKLDNNKISDEGIKNLADWLQNNLSLEHLDLANNKIGPLGAAYLSKSLYKNTTLSSLVLRLNPLGNDGAFVFPYALLSKNRKGPPMKSLDLACTGLGLTALKEVSQLIRNNLISELDLSCNSIMESSESTETEKEEASKELWESAIESQVSLVHYCFSP
ncbi:T-complex-associated testis-expressed protein 1 [Coelomomyces lativittatus]|nr:T-complex-associated testis-expressed protein 1 [Coelomomyces lativittatus]